MSSGRIGGAPARVSDPSGKLASMGSERATQTTSVSHASAPVVRELVAILRSLAEGGTAHVVEMRAAPVAQKRTAEPGSRVERTYGDALELRKVTGIPFWDAVFLTGESDPLGIPDDVVRAALLHQPIARDGVRALRIDDSLEGALTRLSGESSHILALLSKVTTAHGDERHLPMLDFSSKKRRVGAAASVISCARALGYKGAIVDSGRSFHFYGNALITAEELRRFLEQALLLAPVTDARWISHQLTEGLCSLRISRNTKGLAPMPIGQI